MHRGKPVRGVRNSACGRSLCVVVDTYPGRNKSQARLRGLWLLSAGLR